MLHNIFSPLHSVILLRELGQNYDNNELVTLKLSFNVASLIYFINSVCVIFQDLIHNISFFYDISIILIIPQEKLKIRRDVSRARS